MDPGTAAVLAALVVGGFAFLGGTVTRGFEIWERRRTRIDAVRVEIRTAFVEVVERIGDVIVQLEDVERINAGAQLNTALARFGVLLTAKEADLEGMVNATGAMVVQRPHEPETAVMIGTLRKHFTLWYRGRESAEEAHEKWVADVVADLKKRGIGNAAFVQAWEQGSGIPWPGRS